MYNHAIVAGKFWPLHYGHDYLIRAALEQSRRLTILLVFKATDTIYVDERMKWLKEAYPTANVIRTCDLVTDDTTAESNVAWAKYTRELLSGDMPDVVFSSEDYAVGWAQQMGAEHVMVNKHRSFYAISGTQIRNDPYAYFHMIHPAARPYFVKKVLLVGAESTGKTTLCINLAKKYSTVFVPEYGRIYVEKYGIDESVKRDIFPVIVNKQPAMEAEFIKQANRVLLCDTDLWTTYLWYQKWQPDAYWDALGETIREEALAHDDYDLVLLSDCDVPWVQDGLRDQEQSRQWFTDNLMNFHGAGGDHFVFLQGSWQEREDRAIRAINSLFGETEAVLPQPSGTVYVA